MGLINWFLDGVLLTVNVILAFIMVTMIVASARIGLRANQANADVMPWLPPLMAGIFAAISAAIWLGLYWLTYSLLGMPMWMGWIAG